MHWIDKDRKKPQDKNIMSASAMQGGHNDDTKKPVICPSLRSLCRHILYFLSPESRIHAQATQTTGSIVVFLIGNQLLSAYFQPNNILSSSLFLSENCLLVQKAVFLHSMFVSLLSAVITSDQCSERLPAGQASFIIISIIIKHLQL